MDLGAFKQTIERRKNSMEQYINAVKIKPSTPMKNINI
jgi:hypothetical protein